MIQWVKANKLTVLFIGIELLIYCTFLWLDMIEEGYVIYSSSLKYLGIVLCFFYSCIYKKRWLSCGLFFTLISDYFLLFTDKYLWGVSFFLVVQICYSLLLFHKKKASHLLRHILVRYLVHLIPAGLILLCLQTGGIPLDPLLILSVLYFLALVHNVMDAFPKKDIFAAGMVLFLLCDINVAIYNSTSYLPFAKDSLLIAFSAAAMWLFYLPAKVLIALSAFGDRK